VVDYSKFFLSRDLILLDHKAHVNVMMNTE
jgi:hypothetical protein